MKKKKHILRSNLYKRETQYIPPFTLFFQLNLDSCLTFLHCPALLYGPGKKGICSILK